MYRPIVNKRVIKNHFQYDVWKYVAMILIFSFSWNLIITMTAPRTPEELKFDVYFVGQHLNEEDTDALQKQIEELLPQMQEVNVYPLSYEEGGEMEMYSLQKIMAIIAAKEGDVFIFEPEQFKAYGESGVFSELDDYMDMFDGKLSDEQLAKGYFPQVSREYDGNGEVVKEEILTDAHQYGLPLNEFKNMNITNYRIGEQLVGVTIYSDNLTEAITVFKYLVGIE